MKKETSKNTRSHHCNKCLERTEKEKRKLLPRCTILKNVEIRLSSLFPSFFSILLVVFVFSFLCFIPNICCSDVIVISRSLVIYFCNEQIITFILLFSCLLVSCTGY
ncbi:hypothetical protein AABB24_011293 [Solanum stoloniferum]|uniref:Uncharacterized protein n=1 Tax=Solanum stoloniferum TaxID=62892 RepID=A0ABD2UCP6_9SOLN